MENDFKIGEWCFFEFQLVQISDMYNNEITGVSNGYTKITGSNLNERCFKIDVKIKVLSEAVFSCYNKISSIDFRGLNYSDIKRKFVEIWVSMCKNETTISDAETFCEEILSKIEELKNIEVSGIKLLR